MKKLTKKDVIYLAIIVLLVAGVVTMSVLYGTLSAKKSAEDATAYYDNKCKTFALKNPTLSKGQIVFVGDSITDYYPLEDYYSDLSLSTYNRGISGDMTSGVYNRLKTSVYDVAPAKVVLLIGINDIHAGRANDEIERNYTAILDGIKANLPETEVYCISVLPVNDKVEAWKWDHEAATTQIKDLNVRIKALADERGYTFLNLFSHFTDASDHLIADYSDDGLHPNRKGYDVWTGILKPLL